MSIDPGDGTGFCQPHPALWMSDHFESLRKIDISVRKT